MCREATIERVHWAILNPGVDQSNCDRRRYGLDHMASGVSYKRTPRIRCRSLALAPLLRSVLLQDCAPNVEASPLTLACNPHQSHDALGRCPKMLDGARPCDCVVQSRDQQAFWVVYSFAPSPSTAKNGQVNRISPVSGRCEVVELAAGNHAIRSRAWRR